MKITTFILTLFCFVASGIPHYGQTGQTSCIPVKTTTDGDLAFHHGERMAFTLHYNWGSINSDVAHATVHIDSLTYNGQKAYKCTIKGQTTRIYDLFFSVREDFQSWFTRDGLKPLKFYRHSIEGNYESRNTYIYDWNASEPVIHADLYTSRVGEHTKELPLTQCTFDLPALFYFARNMNYDAVEPGRKYPMTFAIDDEIYNVYFILYGPETIKVKGLGTVKTIKFAAKLLEGEVFKGDADMMIWISDDQNRLPVYFEAPLLMGTATGRMTACGGLKYPFKALIK